MSATAAAARPARKRKSTRRRRTSRAGLHLFLIFTTLLWISPILWAIFTAQPNDYRSSAPDDDDDD